MHYIDAELAGHVHNLDVKLQSVFKSDFSRFVVCMLGIPYRFGVNWSTTLCEKKHGVRYFTHKFKCHNRYNKLLLCNSENGDIAWCNKNNSEGVFVFLKKRTKTCFFSKTSKKRIKKTGGLFFLKPGFFSTLIIILQSFFCDFRCITSSGTITSLSIWLCVRRTPVV